MAEQELTQNEKDYIANFYAIGDSITPSREVSIFNSPMQTREDLLKTILWQRNDAPDYYSLASDVIYTDPGKILTGKREDYFYKKPSFPFWSLSSEKEFSDILCGFINEYLPKVNLGVTIPKSTQSIDASFLRHYQRSIALLLRGPPHADDHTIDEDLAEQWVAAQKTPERQRLARLLLDKTLYIRHTDLLNEIQRTIEILRSKLLPGLPTIFLTGTQDKSNYYISLLFYHFWREAGLTVDSFKTYMDEITPGNIIDIDEMAYSGTQTTNTLSKVYKWLVERLTVSLTDLNCKDPVVESFCKSRNFTPIAVLEKIMANNNVNYIIVRIFCSEKGKKELLRIKHSDHKNPLKLPAHVVIGKLLPSPQTLFGRKNAAKLSILFGTDIHSPAAAVYFNHKIANRPSTFLFPYSYGVVPNAPLENLNNYWTNKQNESNLVKEITPQLKTQTNTDEVEFIPFIRYCMPGFRMMPRHRQNLLNYRPPGQARGFRFGDPELPQEYRCPYAWYKRIDYETGTYDPLPLPNIPLPYGPTEENFMGGRRTRRHQRQKKTRKARKQK